MPGFVTKNNVDYNVIWYKGILPATRSYNEDPSDFQAMFTSPITEEYIRLHHLGGGTYKELAGIEKPDQVSIEYGRLLPKPVFYGLGTGYTWEGLIDMSSEDVMEYEAQLQFRDREWMRKQILAPLFNTSLSNPQHFPLWDGTYKAEEGISTPPLYGVLTFTAAHTHYIGTGSPIQSGVMLEDLAAGKKHIREHGHFGRIVGLFAEKQMNQIELLALPIFDATRRAGAVGVTTNKTLSDNPLSNEVVRSGFRGSLIGVDLIESAYIPEDYFILAEVDGARKGMFLQMKSNPVAQGLIRFPGSTQYPILNSWQARWHRPGVRIRSFAVAMQIGAAAAAYTAPSAYSTFAY